MRYTTATERTIIVYITTTTATTAMEAHLGKPVTGNQTNKHKDMNL